MKFGNEYSFVKKTAVLLLFILILSSSGFQDRFTSGWLMQTLPNLGNQDVSGIDFLDSLNGFFITSSSSISDTGYIYKTTNGGSNWFVVHKDKKDYFKIKFVNKLTGYVCGGYNSYNGNLLKTTNGGNNWYSPGLTPALWVNDISVISPDTVYAAMEDFLEGGLFRSTDGCQTWQNLFYQFNYNPDRIYMVNKNLGFMSCDIKYSART
ncbi:MAG: hypothetical protein PHN88_11210, partial [Ignavibacteria bacterium]|nr:hypothetical protein [Ignavibacteria bacterium]